jgi:putative endonuclease
MIFGRSIKAANAKKRDEHAGRAAETSAAMLLRLKGYRILARRFQGRRGEIDLIARRGSVLAFVEVKRRPTITAAAESIGPRQQARIAAAAEEFVAQHPRLASLGIRFDAILVMPGKLPRHMADAWRPS